MDAPLKQVDDVAEGGTVSRLGWLVVLALALLPSWGSLGTPFISDTTGALAYATREGPFEDWTSSQYGLSVVRFWRPMVTTSLALQAKTTGTDPVPLRLFNLLGHAAAALLVVALVGRMGTSAGKGSPGMGAYVAGALVALYPDQGGTVTWIVGRVDSLTIPLTLAAVLLALDRRTALAAVLGFLACASKEIAFVSPALVMLLAWGRGESCRNAFRTALPLCIAVASALVVRRLALGEWVGGYPAPAAGASGGAAMLAALSGAFRAWGIALALPLSMALGCLFFVSSIAKEWRRAVVAALLFALVAALPTAGLLAGGMLEEANQRVLWLSDIGLCLAVGLALGAVTGTAAAHHRWPGFALSALALGLVGMRSMDARLDVLEWQEAGQYAQRVEMDARRALAGATPRPEPLLALDVDEMRGGAYALKFGLADRFRAPFEATPRPVWPLRPVFGQVASQRAPVGRMLVQGGLIDLLFERADGVLGLSVDSVEVTPAMAPLALDASVLSVPDRSPVLWVAAAPEGSLLEVVLYTEMGYEPAPWPGAPSWGGYGTSLRRILLSGERTTLGDALLLSADLGARSAVLQVRAVGIGAAPGADPLAVSRPVLLTRDDALLAEARGE